MLSIQAPKNPCATFCATPAVFTLSDRVQLLTAVMITVLLLLAATDDDCDIFRQSFAIKGLQPHRCVHIVFSVGVNDFMYRYAVG